MTNCTVPYIYDMLLSSESKEALWVRLLHGNATTTQAIRRAIQNSKESLIKLSKRFGINPKTVDKWRKRNNVEDLKAGPRPPAQPFYR